MLNTSYGEGMRGREGGREEERIVRVRWEKEGRWREGDEAKGRGMKKSVSEC